ncbi:MAG: DNA polymerase Y family protein [Bacteroidota bacterium]|nr:DNA polymerase Y family protein [Bacteroidota bacterium]
MDKRFVMIWFRNLKTDWMTHRHPHLKEVPFVLALPDHGRMKIMEASAVAKLKGIQSGMIVADARIILPEVQVFDDTYDLAGKLLKKLCLYCIRYTPITTMDAPNGIILDVSGCAHLWGSEEIYFKNIINKLKSLGFHARAAMADTIGAAWAVCRYGKVKAIIKPGGQRESLLSLPPAALRLESDVIERLEKLGLYQINSFIDMPCSALRRRFGQQLLLRLDQALGNEDEFIKPLIPVEPYSERLSCLELIQTRKGIEIALERLLEIVCKRLKKENKGLRVAVFKCFRVDNKIEEITISTNHPSNNGNHLFKLFELKIATIEPALGIELFILEATKVEDIQPLQETLWTANSSLESKELAELLDRLESKFGNNIVHRYLPDEHHLPERSIKLATSLKEKATAWPVNKLRPIQLLKEPEQIEVTAPIPDYPPMNFRYKGKLHKVQKADACERIEPEWWLDGGLHRDYYIVEDDDGERYWLFRLGHYEGDKIPSWYIHGFFA